MKLSVVIPVYNGQASIERLCDVIRTDLSAYDVEIVLVDDGSRDDSARICERLARNSDCIKFISLRRNFGEHNAVICGLSHIAGDIAAIIDDDFQNPPSAIVLLLEELAKGYDVVYGAYREKKHSAWRNAGSRFNDIVATALLKKPKDLYLSSFKVIRREVIDEIVKYTGPFPYLDGLILRVTRNVSQVYVPHEARQAGRSNYTIRKLVSLWLNMFLNFSILPLRLFTVLGLVVFTVGLFFSVYTIVEHFLSPAVPMGYASIFVAILMLSGIQMVFLGLLGEYLGKNYLEQNGTPQWVIKKRVP